MSAPVSRDHETARANELLEYAVLQVASTLQSARKSRPPLPQPGTFPGYEVIGELRKGGQGTVYKARKTATGRVVALKVFGVHGDRAQAMRTRVHREIAVLAKLSHSNIVSIHDAGISNHGPFLVMDFIEGRPLDEYLCAGDSACEKTAHLLAKVCAAVHAAHLKGVIHRDLKPSNILVDDAGEPHILDFGLARILQEEDAEPSFQSPVTITGQFVGSLPWASPEQAAGDSRFMDARTDIYSLGVILYQLLTGRFPYDVTGKMQTVLAAIQNQEPTKPRMLRHGIDDDLEIILLTCLHKNPDRRYQSTAALKDDLERYLSGHPIQAKRDSTWYVLQRTLARHRVITLTTAFLVMILAAYAVTVTLLLGRARLAEQTSARLAEDARADFRLVQETVQGLLSQWGESFGRVRGAQTAQRAILQQAYAELLPLADRQPREPYADADLALTYYLLGDICEKLGNIEDAKRYLRIAADMRRSRRIAQPDDYDNLAKLSLAIVRLGDCSGGNEQLAHYRRALEIDEKNYEHDPTNAHFRSNLAWSYKRNAAMASVWFDCSDEEYELLQRAQAHFEVITQSPLAPASEFRGLCLIRSRLADVQEQSGDNGASWDLQELTESACRRAVELEPENPIYLCDLAYVLVRIAGQLQTSDDKSRKRTVLDEAQSIFGKLWKDDPNCFRCIEGLSRLAQFRADEARSVGNHEEEESQIQYAHELYRKAKSFDPTRAQCSRVCFRSLRRYANQLYASGQLEAAESTTLEAIAIAEIIVQEKPDPAFIESFSQFMLVAVPPHLRDTSRAVDLAAQGVELSGARSPLSIKQWAVALHADGQIEKAYQAQQQALSMVPPGSKRAKKIENLFTPHEAKP